MFCLCWCRYHSYRLKSKQRNFFMDQLKSFLFDRFVVDWRKDWINNNLHHLVDHLRKQVFDESVGSSQVRIVVDFQQPNPEIFVHQKIIPKKLKFFFLSTSSKKFLNNIIFTLALIIVSIISSLIRLIVSSKIYYPLPSASGKLFR